MTVARRGRVLLCAVVPLLLGACGALAGRTLRPLWMGGSGDPSYPYLLNSLLVAEGRWPALVSHPGAPMFLVCAAVIRLTHLASGSVPLRDHVLTSPDVYVEGIRLTLVLVIALAGAFQGWCAFRLTKSVPVTLLVQMTPLLAPTVMLAHLHVVNEALLFALALVLSGLVVLRLAAADALPASRWVVLAGAVGGIGTATKLTFAGVALVPLMLLRGRARWLYAAITAAFFALALLPVAGRIGVIIEWIGRLALRSGDYGQGPTRLVDGARYAATLSTLVARDYASAGLLAGAAVLYLRLRRRRGGSDPLLRSLGAVVVGVLVSWLGAAKASTAFNYLVPALGLGGCLIALSAALAQRESERGRRLVRAVAIGAAVLVPIHASIVALSYFEQRRHVLPGAAAARRVIDGYGGASRAALGYQPSTVAAAMSFANDWAGHAYSEDLRRLYPDTLSFDWVGFHVFGRPATLGELATRLHGDALLLWTTTWEPIERSVWISGLGLEDLGVFGRDRLLLGHLPPAARDAGEPAPFAGALFLQGLPDLGARFDTGERDRPALGPTARVVFLGDGGPFRLATTLRNERALAQRLVLRLNGGVLEAREFSGAGDWITWERPLPSRPGLNELTLSFAATQGPLDDAFTFRVPGYARDHIEGEVTGIRFRRFQVLREPGSGVSKPAPSPLS